MFPKVPQPLRWWPANFRTSHTVRYLEVGLALAENVEDLCFAATELNGQLSH